MFLFGWNIVLYLALGSGFRFLSMAMSLSLIGSILGLLPFSGVIDRVLRSVSRSVGISLVSSPIRIPVSFSVWSMMASFGLECAIKRSISCSVGMNGSFAVGVYCGIIHVLF